MSPPRPLIRWKALDRDLDRLTRIEAAGMYAARPLVGAGLSLLFVTLVVLVATVMTGGTPQGLAVIVAAAFGAYMGLNIGANDVANNMGPVVGARALPMAGAIALAAICETAGALVAGGDVVLTVSRGIVAPEGLADPSLFVPAMLAALLAASIWINIATWIGAPVSTTHAIVGAVVGAGVIAAGFGAVDWPTVAAIGTSWMITPLIGGALAAALLALLQSRLNDAPDKLAAARRWLPLLNGMMVAAFAAYLGLKLPVFRGADAGHGAALIGGPLAGLAAWLLSVPLLRRQTRHMENRNRSIKLLFRLPLVVSAALLSFAHGANDVANAVAPLAAILHVRETETVTTALDMPLWVMLIGALGISCGLALFGPRLIGLVGRKITKLNPMRAFCVALAAAITVLTASWFGLPVSSTHIAVGGIFGVGFYREWRAARAMPAAASGAEEIAALAMRIAPQERKRRKLVRRSHFLTIVAAWAVTVPAAGLLAALFYLLLRQVGF